MLCHNDITEVLLFDKTITYYVILVPCYCDIHCVNPFHSHLRKMSCYVFINITHVKIILLNAMYFVTNKMSCFAIPYCMIIMSYFSITVTKKELPKIHSTVFTSQYLLVESKSSAVTYLSIIIVPYYAIIVPALLWHYCVVF